MTNADNIERKGKAMDWQPIETAPKNRDILVCLAHGIVTVARWQDDRYARKPRPYWQMEWNAHRTLDDRRDQPLFWQPLPDPPERVTSG